MRHIKMVVISLLCSMFYNTITKNNKTTIYVQLRKEHQYFILFLFKYSFYAITRHTINIPPYLVYTIINLHHN